MRTISIFIDRVDLESVAIYANIYGYCTDTVLYIGYTKREALSRFKARYNLKYKRGITVVDNY